MADRDAFIASLFPAAEETGRRIGVDPRIILAQAALESNWGRSAPGNNFFGIKSHGVPGGNVLATTEVVNGRPVQIRDSFRAFASPADSVQGYGDFISRNPRYAAFRSAQGLDAQLAALGKSGYATDPDYAAKVGSIARSIQGGSIFAAPAAAPAPVSPSSAPGATPPAVPPQMAAAPDASLFGAMPEAPAIPDAASLAALYVQKRNDKKAEQEAADAQRKAALFGDLFGPFA